MLTSLPDSAFVRFDQANPEAGARKWQYDLGTVDWDGEYIIKGPGMQLAADKSKIYITSVMSRRLTAIDAAEGREIWSRFNIQPYFDSILAADDHGDIYSSYIVAEKVISDDEIVKVLAKLDAGVGEKWSRSFSQLSPATGNEAHMINMGHGVILSAGVLYISHNDIDGGHVYALRQDTGEILWRWSRSGIAIRHLCMGRNGLLYFPYAVFGDEKTYKNGVIGLKVDSGVEAAFAENPVGSSYRRLTIARNGTMFATVEHDSPGSSTERLVPGNQIDILEMGVDGGYRKARDIRLPDSQLGILSTVIIGERGVIFVAGGKARNVEGEEALATTLYAIDSQTGSVKWRYAVDGLMAGAPVLTAGGSIYFSLLSNAYHVAGKAAPYDLLRTPQLHAISASTGEPSWRVSLPPTAAVISTLARQGRAAWAVTAPQLGADGTVYLGFVAVHEEGGNSALRHHVAAFSAKEPLAKSDWPCEFGNSRNTGLAE
ncbi:hypothetical protein ACPRNU_04785 [Chromobacterium vaccinii]|uniref:hypothetical protein n=1 Tax=Chromobacterium vaccinii TaxID=1108595 RepID=UPI003C707DF2